MHMCSYVYCVCTTSCTCIHTFALIHETCTTKMFLLNVLLILQYSDDVFLIFIFKQPKLKCVTQSAEIYKSYKYYIHTD